MIDLSPYEMADRLMRVMRYGGFTSNLAFAEHMGWSKQYLGTLLDGTAIGLSVVTAICRKFPEISARWLLLGEGLMIDVTRHLEAVRSWYLLADYIHVMTPEERRRIDAGGSWDSGDLARWSVRLSEFRTTCEERFLRAAAKREKRG